MTSTSRTLQHAGARCAPARGSSAMNGALLAGLWFMLAGGSYCGIADAQVLDDSAGRAGLGSAGVFLESGYPSRTQLEGPFSTPFNENVIVGATRFYNAGFTGSCAVMAN